MAMAKFDDIHAKNSSSCPGDEKLLEYLRAKIAGKIHGDCFAYDVDVCSAPPYKLAEQHSSMAGAGSADGKVWCFFSPVRYVGASTTMRLRTVEGTDGKEFWHAEGKAKPAKGSADGLITKLSYRVKVAPGVAEKPGWLMVEYGVKGADTVLCKIYRSPRGRSAASSSSMSSSVSSGCKRKARDNSDHVEVPQPSTRARLQTDQDHDQREQTDHDDDLGVLIAGDLAEALQFGTEQMAEGQPESQLAPERVGDNNELMAPLEETGTFLMADEDDDAMSFHVPDGVSFEEFYNEHEMEIEDGKQQGAVLPCGESEMVQTTHNPLADYDVIMPLAAGQTAAAGELLDGPSTSGVYGGGLPCPPFDPAYIEEALSTPDPDPADIEELLTASSPAPYDTNMIFHCRWEDSSSLDPYAAQHATAISI
ncbi:hypothetical protein ACP70R_023009 [Stipagrostis hirtigluma subsp. patula]